MKNRFLSFHLNYPQKVTLSILLFTLIPLIFLGTHLTKSMWDAKVRDTLYANSVQVERSAENVNHMYLSSLEKMNFILGNDLQLYTILTTSIDRNLSLVFASYHRLREILQALEADAGTAITIYSFNPESYTGEFIEDASALPNPIMEHILQQIDTSAIWALRTDSIAGEQGYLGLYAKLKAKEIDDITLGIIEIRIPVSRIAEAFHFDMPGDSFLLYDTGNGGFKIWGDGSVHLLEETSTFTDFSPHLPKNAYYVLASDIHISSHEVSLYIPKSHIFMRLRWFTSLLLFVILLLFGLIFFSAKITSVYLTRRLLYLVDKTDKSFDQNAYWEPPLVQGDDELSKLSIRFYEMIAKIKEYYQDRKSMELALLQERINPHFLYNTFSAIKWAYPDKELGKIIDSMVRYYRIALNRGNEILTLQEELSMVEEYIKLQKFVYASDLTFTIQAPGELSDYLILKHTLQPIVENAILHGINGLESGGSLQIYLESKESIINIHIKDNGVGMTKDTVERIVQGGSENTCQEGGYGLKNLQDRIKLYYGEKYGLQIQSQPNLGTTVTLVLPAIVPTIK